MGRKTTSYESILDAAEQVVLKIGAANMTLDAVAKQAKLSKGGLLYHFPNKESLIQAMVSRLIKYSDSSRDQIKTTLPNDPYRDIKTYILAGVRREKIDSVAAAVLAAAAIDPHLVSPMAKHQKDMFKKLSSKSISYERAAVIAFAVTGLWLHEILNISPLTPTQRKKVINEMFAVAKLKTGTKKTSK